MRRTTLAACWALPFLLGLAAQGDVPDFAHDIRPLLQNYCYDCHGDGEHKGKIAFDQYPSDQALVTDHELWLQVLKNVRAGLMPPPQKAQPSRAEKQLLADWIKTVAFGSDPANPDPGQVTLRRL
ncbi:MAG TPA: c-type cytochrome domain-containing protein, partial [Verrucomicrobiae bacterium]